MNVLALSLVVVTYAMRLADWQRVGTTMEELVFAESALEDRSWKDGRQLAEIEDIDIE